MGIYILFMISFIGGSAKWIKTKEFNSEINCLQTINKLIELESKERHNIPIRAFCVKK